MITLAADCLLFQLATGETIPFSAEMISVEVLGDAEELFDAEFVKHASSAVFHYFKDELERQTVSVGEFARALEKVLRGFRLAAPKRAAGASPDGVRESDLSRLASESGEGCELFFFSRLRDELRRQLQHGPRVLRFRGLRHCVKQLAGAQRWTQRCQSLEEQIVNFLRECLGVESSQKEFALVIE